MARTLPPLGEELVKAIEEAWAQPQEEWARKRLLVVRLIAQHQLTTGQIAQAAGVSRKSVFNYRDLLGRGGVETLLKREWAGARKPVVRGAVATEFVRRLEAGQFRQARDAQAWIKKRTRKTLSESGALKVLRRLGGKKKTPRKAHAKRILRRPSSSKRTCLRGSRRWWGQSQGAPCGCGCSTSIAMDCSR